MAVVDLTQADIKAWKLDFDRLAPEKGSSNDPPGFDWSMSRDLVASTSSTKRKDSSMAARKQAALFAKAQAPLKQVGMMCFMAWMFGNSIQIFSIFMTFSLITAPISAILSSGDAFPREEEWKQLDVLTPRILYCVIHFGQLIFGFWKLKAMGLLPSSSADWISTMPVPPLMEGSFAALPMVA